MQFSLMVHRLNSKLCRCWSKFIGKTGKNLFVHQGRVFLNKQIKKAPGRAAPHRRLDWECTKPPISKPNLPFPIEIHQNIQSSDFGGRRQRRQPINLLRLRQQHGRSPWESAWASPYRDYIAWNKAESSLMSSEQVLRLPHRRSPELQAIYTPH